MQSAITEIGDPKFMYLIYEGKKSMLIWVQGNCACEFHL